jgi:predicted RNA-binding protein YlqC (UPF0109 family)
MCDVPQSVDQQLIVLLQAELIELRQQIELKDKQIGQQGRLIKAIQQLVRAEPSPLSH